MGFGGNWSGNWAGNWGGFGSSEAEAVVVDGIDWDNVTDVIHDWVVACTGLSAQKVVWGEQDAPRPEFAAITLRFSWHDDLGQSWIEHENQYLEFSDKVVTVTHGTDTLTKSNHGLLTGDGPVNVTSTGDMPGGLDDETGYWVVKTGANTFKLAASFQDAIAATPTIVDITSNGTGAITVVDIAEETLRQGQEIRAVSRGMIQAGLELRCHAQPGIDRNMAISILQRVRTRHKLPSVASLLTDANIGVEDVGRVLSINGTRDDFLYEPRAVLIVKLLIPFEESEYITTIERIQLTNRIPDPDVDFEVP